MKNFFITGLPRSRTAWLANFMSSGKSICYHEGIDGCHSIEDYQKKMSINGYKYIGDSDTGLPILDFQPIYPDSPVVIIRRDKQEVAESLVGMYGEQDYLPFLEKIERKLDLMSGLVVDFNDIDSRLEEIWSHCISLPYDPIRTKILLNMKVEIMHLEFDQKTIDVFGGNLCLG